MKKRLIISIVIMIFSFQAFAEPQNEEDVLISLMGDVMLDRGIGNLIQAHGVDYPWEQVAPLLFGSDLALVNLETSVGVSKNIPLEKQYLFQSKPETLKGLVNANVCGVSLANNHSLDYGQEGFLETLDHLEKLNIKYAGGGRNLDEALEPAIWNINGIKIGFLAFSRVIPDMNWYASEQKPGIASGYDYYADQVAQRVEETKNNVDFLIVSLHWGKELASQPQDKDVKFAKLLIDHGADVIMGHHPHVLQGIELYNNKPIIYSLGNFVFNSKGKDSNTTMICNILVGSEGIKNIYAVPILIKNGQPTPAEGEEKQEILNRLNNLSKTWDTFFEASGDVKGNIEYAPLKPEPTANEAPKVIEESIQERESLNENKGKVKYFSLDFENNVLTINKKSRGIIGFLESIFIEIPARLACRIFKWDFNAS